MVKSDSRYIDFQHATHVPISANDVPENEYGDCRYRYLRLSLENITKKET